MHRDKKGIVFSASDLVNYIGCEHCTFLDLSRSDGERAPAKSDPLQELLKQKGIEHERNYLSTLSRRGLRVAEVPSDGPLQTMIC